MTQTAYLLIAQKPPPENPKKVLPTEKLSKGELQEIARLVGPNNCPVGAWDQGAVIAFLTDDTATKSVERLKAALGSQMRFAVFELGLDCEEWGLAHHRGQTSQLLELVRRAQTSRRAGT